MAEAPTNLTPETLASTIRQKYPGKYEGKSDAELSHAWLTKYPAYWKNVDAAKFASKGMYQPASTAKPTESTGQIMDPTTGKPRGESMMGKNMTSVVGAASPILSTVGAVAGGALAGPPGAVAGAAYGGMAGEGMARDAAGLPKSPGAEIGAGVTQGALEYVGGEVLPKVLAKVGKSAVPKVYKAINNYIGLKASDLPKWGRTAEEADKIAATVHAEAGVKSSLPAQRDAIEAARKAHDDATLKIVQHPAGRVTDMHALAIDRGVKLLDEVEKEGVPQEQINAIDKNLKGITDNLKPNMTPAELLEAKRGIQNQITTWDKNTTNIRQRYLQGLYHDINSAIATALPNDAAAEYRLHNLIQTRLITAREAAKEKLAVQATKAAPGVVTRATRMVGGAAVGAVSGATIGAETGGSKERGAIVGGLVGAGLGSFGRHVSSVEMPAADIAAQKAISKAAPYLAKVSKFAGPGTPRAVQAVIDAIRSRPDQQ